MADEASQRSRRHATQQRQADSVMRVRVLPPLLMPLYAKKGARRKRRQMRFCVAARYAARRSMARPKW